MKILPALRPVLCAGMLALLTTLPASAQTARKATAPAAKVAAPAAPAASAAAPDKKADAPPASIPPGNNTTVIQSNIPGEPKVEHIVIEDKGSRIEELRVRGTTQRIVVRPKVGTDKAYEIIPNDANRELPDGSNGGRGAAGKRVWNVLDF